MSKNEEEIVLHIQEADRAKDRFFRMISKIGIISFFSLAVFILGFFIKVSFDYYHTSYFAELNTPPIIVLGNYYDDLNQIILSWLLTVIIVIYLFSIFGSLYFLLKNINHPVYFSTSYILVQAVFLFFSFLSNNNYLQKFILIVIMAGAAVFIGLVSYFSKKTWKPIIQNKKQADLVIALSGLLFVLIFTLSLISFNLYMISAYMGIWMGERSGQEVKEKIISGSYKKYIDKSVKLKDEEDVIYFEKCIEKDCFGFTVNDDGKIILKEFDRSEIDHSYIRKK